LTSSWNSFAFDRAQGLTGVLIEINFDGVVIFDGVVRPRRYPLAGVGGRVGPLAGEAMTSGDAAPHAPCGRLGVMGPRRLRCAGRLRGVITLDGTGSGGVV